MIKKIVGFSMALCIFLTSVTTVYAKEVETTKDVNDVCVASVELTAQEKSEFATLMQNKYEKAIVNDVQKKATISENEELVTRVAALTGEEKESFLYELESRGVYELVKEKETNNHSRVGTSDILMRTPSTYYDASNRCWYVTYSGKWLNDNWNTGNIVSNIGDPDAYGISYTQTSGTYSTYVMSSFAHIYDEDETEYLSTRNRSDGNGANGFGFRLQDYTSSSGVQKKYIGYCWGVTCTYSESFSSYNGVATGYYIHTYNEAYISSLTIGVEGKTGGVSCTIQNANKSFVAYSNDIRF